MKKTLLEETKIGEFLAIGAEMDDEEIGLYIASADVSASCGFNYEEWENFIEAVNRAYSEFKKISFNR